MYTLQCQKNCGGREDTTLHGTINHLLPEIERLEYVQIAEFTGHHCDTITRVLREEVDKKSKTRERSSTIAVFDTQIAEWLEQDLSVIRMLELTRANTDHSYASGESAKDAQIAHI